MPRLPGLPASDMARFNLQRPTNRIKAQLFTRLPFKIKYLLYHFTGHTIITNGTSSDIQQF
jgi:hypothetical protein